MSWTTALNLLIEVEGGYVETSPPEGATFAGVMQKYYVVWCAQHGRVPTWPPTQEAVASYYHDAYYTPYHCDAFPEPADAVALQLVANLPWQQAHQALQVAAGAYPDADICDPSYLAQVVDVAGTHRRRTLTHSLSESRDFAKFRLVLP